MQGLRALTDPSLLVIQQSLGKALLVAVSKGQPIEKLEVLYAAGQRHFAESYVQEAIGKIQRLPNDIIWHFIGTLQSNKLPKIARYFNWVQSIDSESAALRLNQLCEGLNKTMEVCLCLNMDCEPQKTGVFPQEVYALASAIKRLPYLSLRGLMVIPKAREDIDEQLIVFQKVKTLFDELNAQGFRLDTLSMGMSADYPSALAAGSTMVRLGTALFGCRTK